MHTPFNHILHTNTVPSEEQRQRISELLAESVKEAAELTAETERLQAHICELTTQRDRLNDFISPPSPNWEKTCERIQAVAIITIVTFLTIIVSHITTTYNCMSACVGVAISRIIVDIAKARNADNGLSTLLSARDLRHQQATIILMIPGVLILVEWNWFHGCKNE